MENYSTNKNEADRKISNKDQQGVDKAPGEEIGKGEIVTNDDLKGKKVDADPELIYEQPIQQLP